MRTRIALFLLFAVAIVAGAELSSLLVTTSPYSATGTELWLFFVSLYIVLSIIVGLLWQGIKLLRPNRSSTTKPKMWQALRQGALFALVIVLSLFFKTLGIFQIWNVVPLALAALLIEFFFQADKTAHATLSYGKTNE